MKKTVLYILFVWLFVSTGLAYTYEVYTYGTSKWLEDDQSILVANEGGMPTLKLDQQSSATVQGTSSLGQGTGGIWTIELSNNSDLYMTGGQVNEIALGNNATVRLTGGLIQQIWSSQYTGTFGPHITIVYSGELPTIQTIYGLPHLVGNWGNGDPFSIYLHNTGYNVYGNFNFILVPEPGSLALLAGGVLALRRKNADRRI